MQWLFTVNVASKLHEQWSVALAPDHFNKVCTCSKMPSTPKLYTWHYFTCFGFVLCYVFYFCFFVVVVFFFHSPKIPLLTQFLKKYFCQKRKSRCNTYLHKVFQKKERKRMRERDKKRSLPPSQCRNPRSAEWQLWSPATKCGTPSPTGASPLLDTQSPLVPGQHT